MTATNCRARVWDNGDMTDCGEASVRLERCAEHIAGEIASLESAIRSYEKKIKDARLRIEALGPSPRALLAPTGGHADG